MATKRPNSLYDSLQEVKEKIEASNERTQGRRVSLAMGREALFFEHLENVLGELRTLPTTPVKYSPKFTKRPVQRILNIMLSDLHFGARMEGGDLPRNYGPVEEARRLAHIVQEVCTYKMAHRQETILYVHLLGDIIEGKLHDTQVGAPLAEQFAAACGLLQQAIQTWASNFRQVVVRCTPGNHGRNTARHQERAVHEKWDGIETMIYMALESWSLKFPNVKFEVPKTPYYMYQAFDKWGFMTHGDTVVNFGYPGKSINSARVEAQVNALITHEMLLNPESPRRLSLVGGGHVHIGSCTYLSNGAAFMTNGALVPPNGFSVSMGSLTCVTGQWLWESVPGHIIGDSRFITVSDEHDQNSNYDTIIKPLSFKGRKTVSFSPDK